MRLAQAAMWLALKRIWQVRSANPFPFRGTGKVNKKCQEQIPGIIPYDTLSSTGERGANRELATPAAATPPDSKVCHPGRRLLSGQRH
eukprot:scaffold125502_cov15-Tisochrysis_lutea.AAC.2